MVHLVALIWVPFLTLFFFSSLSYCNLIQNRRIHMHNVIRDLLYEYEYYRPSWTAGYPLRRTHPNETHIIFGAINARKKNRK